jgi:cytochrome c biogenesis protein CcdA
MKIVYLGVIFAGFTARSFIISLFGKQKFDFEDLVCLFNLSFYFWLIVFRQSVLSIIVGVGYLIWINTLQDERDKFLIIANILLIVYGAIVLIGVL